MPFNLDPRTGQKLDAYGNPVPDYALPPPAPGMPQAAPQPPAQSIPFMLQRSTPDPAAQPSPLPAPPALAPQPVADLPPVPRPMPGMPEPYVAQPSSTPAPFVPLTTATDTYTRSVAETPKTSLLQRLGAMALGGAAGYANAGGRVRIDPQAIQSATSNILYPGRDARLAREKTAMGIEQMKNAAGRQASLDTANVGLTQARTMSELERTELYKAQAQKALNDPNHYQMRPDGSIFDQQTGQIVTPAKSQVAQVIERMNAWKAAGGDMNDPRLIEYSVTGKMPKASKEGKLSLQERLSALYAIPNRTPDQTRELKSIEKAMTLVANTYGAGFKMMSTPEGQPFMFHPNQGVVTPPGNARMPYSASERKDVAALDGMVEDVALLRVLAEEKKDKIGPISGRVADLNRKFLGADSQTNDLFRISDNLADQLLRVRSGAQINEQEYARLRLLTPNPRYAASKFFSDLAGFEKELKNLLAKRSGAAPLVTNSTQSPQPSPSRAPSPLGSASKPGDRTPDGGIIRSVKTRTK